jgi:Fic family protein
MYLHERSDWPHFTWDQSAVASQLASVRHRQGLLMGRLDGLGLKFRQKATFDNLSEDVLKTSEIEGEKLDAEQVRSSIARRLGIDKAALPSADRHIEGVVQMLMDATQNYSEPLTQERLFGWHHALFQSGRSGIHKIDVGKWRNDKSGPMRVISGHVGREHIHFEAPAAPRLAKEMKRFLAWYNSEENIDGVLKAAIAHLWFVTIHPFDDGNGRIARAIADMTLARSESSPQRCYSMSAQIRVERKAYYDILQKTDKGSLDITPWLEWFLNCLAHAISTSEKTLSAVIEKAAYWNKLSSQPLNNRQRDMINRLLDGFIGKLTSTKWAQLTHSSQDTASRDIVDLIKRRILLKNDAGGRSTSYSLNMTHLPARPVKYNPEQIFR